MLVEVCLAADALATSSPPSSAKNVMELYTVAKELARLGFARVRKLVCVGREKARKLERGQSGLGCASRDALARMCVSRCSCSEAPVGSCTKA
ncbi:hypothetical protein B296_00028464 [Ensete ventricosum]|uniref:Uncharacterized protein n=1 Tax=Ensete ventricosum TaxID=4639 RepID=A0A426YLZ1_ENSVE|nr:hypothetical protein B296_00028464 [Ensete ventricosum]